MPFAAILIGAIIIIAAFNGTHTQLASELETDLPGYFKWAVAIAAILGLGFIPGLEKPSRYLLALVIVVLVLTNYQQIISGFQSFAAGSGQPSQPVPTSSQSSGAATAVSSVPSPTTLIGDFNPADYIGAFGAVGT